MQNDWLLGGWYSWILIPLGIFELIFFRTWYFHGIKIFDHQKEMYVLMWPGQWVKLSCYYTNVTVRKATKDLNIILWVCVIKWSSVRELAMVFNVTFNNISVISWWSVLLVGETTDLSQVDDPLYHIMLYWVHLVMNGFELTTFMAICTDVNSTTIRSRPPWTHY